jgi:DNA segregation ATPase FtsK/SpoIIIE-like protein
MISGTTGRGKTNFLFNLICSLLYKHTNDIELLIVDLKQIDFIYFNGVKCCYKEKVITHNFQLEEMMMHLEEEYYTRKKLLSKHNFNTFKNIILIVDEYVELIYLIDKLGFRKRMEKLLKNISSNGQELGIHLILASQCFRKEYLKSKI